MGITIRNKSVAKTCNWDKMNAEDTIYDKSLYAINQTQTPRVVYLTTKKIPKKN